MQTPTEREERTNEMGDSLIHTLNLYVQKSNAAENNNSHNNNKMRNGK